MEICVYKCYITWARTYLLRKIVCIPEHDMSRGHSLIGILSPAGRSGRSLFHHLREALAFTCFFCLWFLSSLLVTLMMPCSRHQNMEADWAGLFVRLLLHQEQRCYVFSPCSSALIKFQAFYVLIWLCHLVAMLWWWSKWTNLRMNCKQTDLCSLCIGYPACWSIHCFKLIHWPVMSWLLWVAAQIARFGVRRHIPLLPMDSGKSSVFPLRLCWLPYTCHRRPSDVG